MNLLQRLKNRAFGYDAVDDKKRRRPPVSRLRSEDKELSQQQRGTLITSSRQLQRSFSIAAFAIRKHLDYVSSFTFQSRTGRPELDRKIEDLMTWWGRRRNCDVAERHSFRRMIRLAEARRTVDGDIFLLKVRGGRLQAIEADRVRTPTIAGTDGVPSAADLTHGVELSPVGRAKRYCVCKREKGNGQFSFDRMVSARNVIHHGFFDRFDQVRGISPLAAAVNSFEDTYENFDAALAKAKVAELFALAIYREAADNVGVIEAQPIGDGQDGEEEERYNVDFGRGPLLLNLDPGDRAEFLESRQPSSEFQAFCQVVIGASLKSLDIPYSFFDESFSTYSGSRQALLQYEQSANEKRQDLRDDVLNPITAWRLALWLIDGRLELPAGLTLADLRWEWIATGLPWIDPLKEVNADLKAIGGAISSRTRVLKKQGLDFHDIADELAEEKEYLEAKGLPGTIAAGPAPKPAAK